MSSRDPETGCALILLGSSALCLVVAFLLAILVDWRLPVLIYVVSTMLVLGTLLKLDVDEWRAKRRR